MACKLFSDPPDQQQEIKCFSKVYDWRNFHDEYKKYFELGQEKTGNLRFWNPSYNLSDSESRNYYHPLIMFNFKPEALSFKKLHNILHTPTSQSTFGVYLSSQKKQLLQKFFKFLAIKTTCAKFLQQSRNTLLFISCKRFARVAFLAVNAISVKILQDLSSNILPLNTLRSDNLCVSPESKHNEPLQVKIDEIYISWKYFVIERV